MQKEYKDGSKQGALLAISAYTIWGMIPIYFKAIDRISPLEIMSNRVIWSFFLLMALLYFGHSWNLLKHVFFNKTKMFYLLITSTLLGINWLFFVWAINANRMLDASLGYYINPLLNVLLGMLFLKEKLNKLQWLAVTLAFLGVLVQLIMFGSVPIVALVLALTFGFYGLLRKKIAIDAKVGLFLETLILFPISIIYLFIFSESSTTNFINNSFNLNILLIASGILTTLPLLFFAGATTYLKLSTLGFFQYIGPSLTFLLAVLFYKENLTIDKIITFFFIWLALLIFSFDGIQHNKQSNSYLKS